MTVAAHASANYRNAMRSTLRALASADLGGCPLIPPGDEKFDSSTVERFVRLQFRPMDEIHAGRIVDSGTTRKAARASLMCIAEVYCKGVGFGSGSVVDEVDGLADRVAHALRYLDVQMLDLVTDPSGATAVSNCTVRFHRGVSPQYLPPDGGWQRRIVQAEGEWIARHAE